MSTEIKAFDLNDEKSFRVYVISKLSEIKTEIRGTNNRLDTLNGKVARHEKYIVADEASKAGENQIHYINCANTKDVKYLTKLATQLITAKNIFVFLLCTIVIGLGGLTYRIYADIKTEKNNTEVIMQKLETLIDKK